MRAYLLGACLLAACFDQPADVPFTYTVGGTVAGMWDGASVSLRLQAGEIDVTETVDANGEFAFDAQVPENTSFTVSVTEPDAHTCTGGGADDVVDRNIEDVTIECTGPTVEVALSAPIPFAFDVDTLAYDLDVSTLIQQTAVTITAPAATARRLDDADLVDATPSAPVGLALGANTLTLEVEAGDAQRTFTVTIDRGAAEIEQYVYGKASNTGMGDYFGFSIAYSEDTVAVGAPGESSNATVINGPDNDLANRAGAVYVLRRVGSTWQQEAYIKASAGGATDEFGSAVALDGSTLVVGAPSEEGGIVEFPDSGAVYVYQRAGNTWSEAALLRAPDLYANLHFGTSVAIDADTIAVGAIGDGPNFDSGTTYFYRRNGSSWEFEDQVKGAAAGRDAFGQTVSVSGDVAVVGSPGSTADAAYVFRRQGSDWSAEQVLVEVPSTPNSNFGSAVSTSGDTIVVGSSNDACACRGIDPVADNGDALGSGAVHVFRFDGSDWVREAYIKASNSDAGDAFGVAVDLEGDQLVVGAYGEAGSGTGSNASPDDNAAPAAGAAYVFERVGTGWSEAAYLKPSNAESFDRFGGSVANGRDGVVCAAHVEESGAQGINGDDTDNASASSGAIYVYR